jgi:5S rRNA maturation endonuclease (ribonuclease M5)
MEEKIMNKTFDFTSFCDDAGIEYWTEGKNVTEGWINIQCPHCDDRTNHLGFDPSTGQFNCWKCGSHSLWDTLIELEDEAHPQDIVRQYQTGDVEVKHVKREKKEVGKEIELPPDCHRPSNMLASERTLYSQYLTKRRFGMVNLSANWNIHLGGVLGEYKFRIVIPVYYKHKMVSLVARDVTGKQEPKYLNLPDVNLKEYLYGYDSCVGSTAIVVEGITDVWRLGKGMAVATFGTQVTLAQIRLLQRYKKIVILFDRGEEAQREAEKIKQTLLVLGGTVVNAHLPDGVEDPADMSDVQIEEFLKKNWTVY